MKFTGVQPARRQSRHQRARTGHRLDAQTRFSGSPYYALARITNPRRASVGYERDFLTRFEAFQDRFTSFRLVELKVTEQRLGNPEMLEQLASTAGVLGR